MYQNNRGLFQRVNDAALAYALPILQRWLPNGEIRGGEYVAINPKRLDTRRGSFKVNIATGKWSDFAIGESGGDLISLAAYLFDSSQLVAARNIAKMLDIKE